MKTTSLLALALPVLFGSCAGFHLETASEERTFSAPIGESRSIRVETVNGQVTILAEEGRSDVEVRAVVKASARTIEEAEARLPEIGVIAENVNGGDLAISVVFPDGKPRSNEGCAFDIRTPIAHGVLVDTSNGSITVEGLSGRAELHTSNGPVSILHHDGDLLVRTSNGRIVAEGRIGTADLDSSNGGITVTGARGRVTADTSNGNVLFRPAAGYSSPFRIDSSNGNVEVRLPDDASVECEASTSNGSVTVSGHAPGLVVTGEKKNERRIRIGRGGGAASEVSTSNGTITVAIVSAGAEREEKETALPR